jgi:hypothetical protein
MRDPAQHRPILAFNIFHRYWTSIYTRCYSSLITTATPNSNTTILHNEINTVKCHGGRESVHYVFAHKLNLRTTSYNGTTELRMKVLHVKHILHEVRYLKSANTRRFETVFGTELRRRVRILSLYSP